MPRPNATFSPPEAGEVFFTSAARSREIRRAVEQGQAREVAPRLYTTNMTDAPEAVIGRNLWRIVAGYAPGALVADRTAFESRPTGDGDVFLVGKARRRVELPGLTIHVRPGPGPITDRQLAYADTPFIGGLWLSSFPRRLLENIRPSRRGLARTLSQAELEAELEKVFVNSGPEAVNRWRDQAREIAETLQMHKEFEDLDRLIGAMMGTQDTRLESDVASARRAGLPYDPSRLEIFENLRAELHRSTVVDRPLANGAITEAFAFYEAYFSNYIEGTKFTVEEAEAIVFEGRIPRERPEDAHDVEGTFRLTVDPVLRARVPESPERLIEYLKAGHAVLMGGRPDVRPGEFKLEPNRAGGTIFVAPTLATGTLQEGFEYYQSLTPGFPRAVFMMFLVAEVHPFADGNGRMARLMMNAELTAVAQQRIIVPTSRRDDYLGGLRALSNRFASDTIVRGMDRLQAFSASIDWSSRSAARMQLETARAFDEADSELGGAFVRVVEGAADSY